MIRKIGEAVLLAVVIAAVAMIIKSGHGALRAIVILAIFIVDFILDASPRRKYP